ncbi:carboxypeptidase-like regulatory domain-containing protein [Nakamurella sp.]|uniref:carboxypeptidase-like regulatory domain-containing protein n=1 Tax=Nakamurella sp. TaxID=1869182 RepID=UPI003B3B2454
MVLWIGLGVMTGVLASGCAQTVSPGAGGDTRQSTARGAASSGATGSSDGEGRDPVGQPPGSASGIGSSGDRAASSAAAGSVRPTGGEDAPVSTDGAVGALGTAQARSVDGAVTDQDGRPVTGALVTPTSLDTPSTAIPEVAVFTDDQGRYSWVLPMGRYRLTVTANGYQQRSVEISVPETGSATADLQLPRE